MSFADNMMYNTPENPAVNAMQLEIDALKEQYKKIVAGEERSRT